MNKLYYGDNLDVMRRYIKDESVDLCYIDPPFNSKRNYNQIYNNVGQEDRAQAQAFVDTWTWDIIAEQGLDDIIANHRGLFTRQTILLIEGLSKVLAKGSLLAYLVSMTLRIVEIHRILKPTGSFYLHCDQSASHYLKIILDAIFCSQGGDFKNEIVWVRSTNPKGSQYANVKFSLFTDSILFYTKSDKSFFDLNSVRKKLKKGELEKKYDRFDEQGRFTDGPVTRGASMGDRPNLVYEYKGFTPDRYGWRLEKQKLIDLDAAGNLGWSSNGKPYRKIRPSEDKGEPVGNFWSDISLLNSQSIERLGYPTQKPEALLERIIQASSQEGDVVFDAYCGCGTTVAVSQRLTRQWVGIDITYQSISLILKRLEDSYGKVVADAVKLTGVPKDFAGAAALAHQKDDRTRKEFEKWAVLTFSQNRAIINEKKGGDGGIDGTAFVLDSFAEGGQGIKPIIFSVKSNETLTPAAVRDLYGTVEREKAAMGYLLTLNSMNNLVKESKKYGFYTNELFGSTYPKIEVISVSDILNGERIRIPLNQKIDVVRSAKGQGTNNQLGLF